MPQNMENSAMATGLEKVSIHSNSKEKQCQIMFKLAYNVLISHSHKVIFKILKAMLQQGFSSLWTENSEMYIMGFEKAEESGIKLPTYAGS